MMLNGFVCRIFGILVLLLAGCTSESKIEKALRLKRKGIDNFKKGDYRTAVRALHKASALNTEDSEIYWYLASSYESLEKFDQAIESWQKFLYVSNPRSSQSREAH